MSCRWLLVVLASCLLVANVGAQAPPAPRVDSVGDPLPEGAVARLGTLRLKHGPFGGRNGQAQVGKVVFSPDGNRFASLDGNSIRLWDRASGKEIRGPWNSNDFSYSDVVFSPNGALLAYAGYRARNGGGQAAVVLSDIAGGKEVKEFVQNRSMEALMFADGGKTLVLAGAGVVSWWDIATAKEMRSWKPFAGEKRRVPTGPQSKTFDSPVISPDAKSIAVHVEWTDDTRRLRRFVTFDAKDHEACGFDLGTGKMTWRATGKYNPEHNSQFAYSADSQRVALSLGPDRLEVRNARTGKLIAAPLARGFTGCSWIGGLALSSDGATAALAGDNSKLVLWNTAAPLTPRKAAARGWPNSGHCLHFSPDNKTLLLGIHIDLQLYDVATLQEVRPWEGHRQPVDFVAFTQDGKRVLTGVSNSDLQPRELSAWDVDTWRQLQRTATHTPPRPNVGNLSPDQSVYTGNKDADRLAVYKLTDGKLLTRFHVPSANKAQGANGFFSPSGKHYVLIRSQQGDKSGLRVFAVSSGKLRCVLPAMPGFVSGVEATRSFAFSSDEHLVALFGREDGKIYICDIGTGKMLHVLGTGWAGVDEQLRQITRYNFSGHLAFSRDNKFLASWIVTENIIRVWEVATGRELLGIVTEDELGVNYSYYGLFQRRLCFSLVHGDSRVLAVGGDKIQLWELATTKVRREWTGHEGAPIRVLAYSPNGRFLASGSADTTTLIWDIVAMDSAGRRPGDLAKHWQALTEDDGVKAFAAIRDLSKAPSQSIAWIQEHVKPAAPITAKHVDDLIAQLDERRFQIREKATAELVRIAERAVPAIDRALAGKPALETRRRLEQLRTRAGSAVLKGDRLQAYRAVEVLERIGTPEAREVLQALAAGAEGALVTVQAHEALVRLQ